jgi:hypothetical protein
VKINSLFKSNKMKILQLIVAGIVLCLAGTSQAQVSVNVNIGTPPPLGPAGYSDVRYYYLPDLETYYDVQSSLYIYSSGGRWVHSRYLPSRYRNYNLYNGYKVVLTDYHGNTPYTYFNDHKSKYARGYHGQAQRNIGERPGNGNNRAKAYSGVRQGREYNIANIKHTGNGNNKNMKMNNGNGNGNGKGKGNGNGNGNGNGRGNGNGHGNGNGNGKNK